MITLPEAILNPNEESKSLSDPTVIQYTGINIIYLYTADVFLNGLDPHTKSCLTHRFL